LYSCLHAIFFFFFDPDSWLYPASTSAISSIKMSFIRKIVHNDAVKLDPPEVYNWRVFALACAACFGGTLFGMDIGIIGGVLTLPDFKKYALNYTPLEYRR
jgi:hypothetical protein